MPTWFKNFCSKSLALLLIISSSLLIPTAMAGVRPSYDLYVFYNKYCQHCKSWLQTTGSTYNDVAPVKLGKGSPKLYKYDLSERKNMRFYQELLSQGKLSSPLDAVPAFIIMDQDQVEVTRTVGAMDEKDFYKFIKESIDARS